MGDTRLEPVYRGRDVLVSVWGELLKVLKLSGASSVALCVVKRAATNPMDRQIAARTKDRYIVLRTVGLFQVNVTL